MLFAPGLHDLDLRAALTELGQPCNAAVEVMTQVSTAVLPLHGTRT